MIKKIKQFIQCKFKNNHQFYFSEYAIHKKEISIYHNDYYIINSYKCNHCNKGQFWKTKISQKKYENYKFNGFKEL